MAHSGSSWSFLTGGKPLDAEMSAKKELVRSARYVCSLGGCGEGAQSAADIRPGAPPKLREGLTETNARADSEKLAEFERRADPHNPEMQEMLRQMRQDVASLVRTSNVDSNVSFDEDPNEAVVDKQRGFYIP